MSIFGDNLRKLRKQKGLTQAQLAEKLGVNRSAVGAYEEGRAEPRMKLLVTIAHYFGVSTDQLLNRNADQQVDVTGKYMRVLPVMVDRETDRELVPLVPQKARAGYLAGLSDMEYIESLPRFALPFKELQAERTYRVFEISGDSMLPIPDGAYVITEYVPDWSTIKDGQCYVMVTLDEGISYKRVKNLINESQTFELISDNPEYDPYSVPLENVKEVWKALGYISFNLPESGIGELNDVRRMLMEMKSDIKKIKG